MKYHFHKLSKAVKSLQFFKEIDLDWHICKVQIKQCVLKRYINVQQKNSRDLFKQGQDPFPFVRKRSHLYYFSDKYL